MVLEFQLLPKYSSTLEEILLKISVDEHLVSHEWMLIGAISFTYYFSMIGFQRYLIATDSNSTLIYTGCDSDTTIWPGSTI